VRAASSRLASAVAVASLSFAAACTSSDAFHKEARWPTPLHGAIVTEHPLATQVGLDILNRGGNAADAAIAASFALAVVYPQAGNLGGGGFALFVPHSGVARAFDFRETAPAAASAERYLDAQRRVVPERALRGALSVAVPGSPAGLFALYQACGSKKLRFAELVQPAIDLAERGFHVDAWLARDLASKSVRERMNDAARELFYPHGVALREGQVLKQRELAETLSLIANGGPDAFYNGRIAQAIARELAQTSIPQSSATGRDWITPSDLAAYEVKEREPLSGWFRGMQIVTMPPPSSGGVLLLQVLGILEGLPLDAERKHALEDHRLEREQRGATTSDDPGLDERMVHWWIEALRRAFADRAAQLGDPDASPAAAAAAGRLLAPDWIAARRISIGENADPGVAPLAIAPEGTQTTHVSALDVDGNAVSLTTTLNEAFGSGILVRGGGFLLNDEIDDFAIQAGAPNMYGLVGGSANALAPGKRPLSSMTPAVLRDGGHATTMVIGSPGGPRIITAIAQVLLRVLVLEQSIHDAVRAPRLHQQWMPRATRFERGFAKEIVDALSNRRGHEVEWSDKRFGSVQAIWLAEPGADPVGVSDPRRGGSAVVQGAQMSTPARPPSTPEPEDPAPGAVPAQPAVKPQ
jgi:gamma-glutamyltranspeptidase/glutathione hydrolase